MALELLNYAVIENGRIALEGGSRDY